MRLASRHKSCSRRARFFLMFNVVCFRFRNLSFSFDAWSWVEKMQSKADGNIELSVAEWSTNPFICSLIYHRLARGETEKICWGKRGQKSIHNHRSSRLFFLVVEIGFQIFHFLWFRVSLLDNLFCSTPPISFCHIFHQRTLRNCQAYADAFTRTCRLVPRR